MIKYRIIDYTECTLEQKREIFEIRNLPDMRKWAENPVELVWEEHLQFIERLVGDENRKYYAVFMCDALIGSYNLHREEGSTWSRGLFASPMYQGRGYTSEWERLILSSLPKDEFQIIKAEVKINNPRSIRYHEKLGFHEVKRDSAFVYYTLELA